MSQPPLDLWTLTRGRPQIDPNDLAQAVGGRQATEADLDYRTRLLIRDSAVTLRLQWGPVRFSDWLRQCSSPAKIEEMLSEEHEKIGFPSLRRRVKDKTSISMLRSCFAFASRKLNAPTTVFVGGSAALILANKVERQIERIHIVGPEPFPESFGLTTMKKELGLVFAKLEPYYLPSGWKDRAASFEIIDNIHVALVSVYDVFLSKVFSPKMDDMSDLLVLSRDRKLDRNELKYRLNASCGPFLSAPRLHQIAQDNWDILFGEGLPS